jgi:hypothetical protein
MQYQKTIRVLALSGAIITPITTLAETASNTKGAVMLTSNTLFWRLIWVNMGQLIKRQ